MLCDLTGANHAVAIVNGTCALHLALKSIGVQPENEVLCPSLSFVATANAISHCHATPHFIDSETNTLGLCPNALAQRLDEIAEQRGDSTYNTQSGQRIAAIVPMHTFGHPCQIDAIVQVAQRYRLPIIEDAAESLGSTCNGKHTGRFGKAGILSFNGNKIVTCGGGGAILTEDDSLAQQLKHLSTTAKQPHPWDYFHDAIGYNYRMPNLNAALGCGQLEYLDQLIKAKRSLAYQYRDAIEPINGVRWLDEPEGTKSNFWLNCILLDPDRENQRDAVLQQLSKQKIHARPIWRPLHQLPIYNHAPRGRMENAETLSQRVINLPSSAHLWQGLNPPED